MGGKRSSGKHALNSIRDGKYSKGDLPKIICSQRVTFRKLYNIKNGNFIAKQSVDNTDIINVEKKHKSVCFSHDTSQPQRGFEMYQTGKIGKEKYSHSRPRPLVTCSQSKCELDDEVKKILMISILC